MPLSDDELRDRAAAARLLCSFHYGRSVGLEEALAQPANESTARSNNRASAPPTMPATGQRGWVQRSVLEIMRTSAASMRAGEIRAEALRRGCDVRRDQITAALERMESRGIVKQRAGAWHIVELVRANAAMAEEDAL